MKKVLLGALLAITSIAYAQVNPSANLNGKWWISGGLNYQNDDASKTSTFQIMPVVGTFISPSVTVGLGVGYASMTNESTGTKVTSDAFVVKPLARKYWSVGQNLYLFGQAAVPMKFEENVKTFGFELSPGVDYFITENFTIEASLGALSYTNVSPKVGDSKGVTQVGLNMGNLNFGLKYMF